MTCRIQKVNTRVADGPVKQRTDSAFKRGMKEGWQTTKSVGKFAVKHPLLTVGMLVIAASSVKVANAQTAADSIFAKEKFRHGTLAPPSAFPNVKINNFKPTTVKPKEIGEKYFDTQIEGDTIHVVNVKFGKQYLKLDIFMNVSPQEVKNLWNRGNLRLIIQQDEEKTAGVNLIFEEGIIRYSINKETRILTTTIITPAEGKIFANEKAVFITSDNTLLLSTPTEIIINRTNGLNGGGKYKELFGDVPDLTDPAFVKGGVDNLIYLKDPIMGKYKVKIEMGATAKLSVISDELYGAVR